MMDVRQAVSLSSRPSIAFNPFSSLAHPNICTIYEVGETNGELYIVMELVIVVLDTKGKSLREMCAVVGLPSESVLRYGVQTFASENDPRINMKIGWAPACYWNV